MNVNKSYSGIYRDLKRGLFFYYLLKITVTEEVYWDRP